MTHRADVYVWSENSNYDGAAPKFITAVSGAYDGEWSVFDGIINSFKAIGDLVSFATNNMYGLVSGDASKFTCMNLAALVDGVPAAGALCVTGDGKIFVGLGFGIPGGSYIIGQTQTGQPASDILTAGAFSFAVIAGNAANGVIFSTRLTP